MWKIIVKATTNDKVTDVVHIQKKSKGLKILFTWLFLFVSTFLEYLRSFTCWFFPLLNSLLNKMKAYYYSSYY